MGTARSVRIRQISFWAASGEGFQNAPRRKRRRLSRILRPRRSSPGRPGAASAPLISSMPSRPYSCGTTPGTWHHHNAASAGVHAVGIWDTLPEEGHCNRWESCLTAWGFGRRVPPGSGTARTRGRLLGRRRGSWILEPALQRRREGSQPLLEVGQLLVLRIPR